MSDAIVADADEVSQPVTTVISPERVISPKDRLKGKKIEVVYQNPTQDWAMATAYWDGRPVLVMRWNGTPDRPKGNPISNFQPTWFVVPDEIRWSSLNIIADMAKRIEVAAFLDSPDIDVDAVA